MQGVSKDRGSYWHGMSSADTHFASIELRNFSYSKTCRSEKNTIFERVQNALDEAENKESSTTACEYPAYRHRRELAIGESHAKGGLEETYVH